MTQTPNIPPQKREPLDYRPPPYDAGVSKLGQVLMGITASLGGVIGTAIAASQFANNNVTIFFVPLAFWIILICLAIVARIRWHWYAIIPAVIIGGLLPLMACGLCVALLSGFR